MTDAPEPDRPDLDPDERRRRRTRVYLGLWGVDADVRALPLTREADVTVREPAEVVGRAKVLCLCALKGQGLTQHETFAFADAYEVWDHLTVDENEFVLDPAPDRQELIQQAWRTEGLWVLEWSLGLVRHLAFPDRPADVAEATRICIERLCASDEPHELRPRKDLLDGADIARVLDAVSLAARAQGTVAPGNLHPGVVFERQSAFSWLVSTVG